MNKEIKFVVNNIEYTRSITVNISKTGATGNVMNGETKTGFYRWNKGYKYPMFFSSKGKQIKGAAPINTAIAEAVKNFCNQKRAERTVSQAQPELEVETPVGQASIKTTPTDNTKLVYGEYNTLDMVADNEPELTLDDIVATYGEEEY